MVNVTVCNLEKPSNWTLDFSVPSWKVDNFDCWVLHTYQSGHNCPCNIYIKAFSSLRKKVVPITFTVAYHSTAPSILYTLYLLYVQTLLSSAGLTHTVCSYMNIFNCFSYFTWGHGTWAKQGVKGDRPLPLFGTFLSTARAGVSCTRSG